ncbi:MAG: Na+/H+ antiporter NhaC family protein, partial [Bacteriovoracaceae bacterium]
MLKKQTFNFIIFGLLLIGSYIVGKNVSPYYSIEKVNIDAKTDEAGKTFYTYKGKPKYFEAVDLNTESTLAPSSFNSDNYVLPEGKSAKDVEEYAFTEVDGKTEYYLFQLKQHFGIWSLLPAFAAVLLCWITREPVTALAGGVITGAFLMGKYQLFDEVFIPSLMSKSSASIIILYLWLMGGLVGMWSKTGAARAFAEFMTKKFVKGPRSAKLISWFLGVIFFQGGTISTVLVGTTVKPLADKENISHEELSYIVDSTASPIASQLAFNAWPGYIQALIYVSGVAWLATESDRISFFFKSVPFCFYAIFAVLGTFLLSIDKSPWLGKKLKAAIKRSRETGELDAPGANPLRAEELEDVTVPEGYTPSVVDFFVPLGILIGTCLVTFALYGSPYVQMAFGFALLSSIGLALFKGMALRDLIEGMESGMKGVVLGSVILLLAITIGGVSKDAGGGIYLMELLGGTIPYWILPAMLFVLTLIIAFSTGTSWGTYAVAFPLAMPLAYAVAQAQGLAHPEFFMTICFATVMDGSVFGDQCSPISDTTVLSSLCTGCDLMDHVKTQIPQAALAGG